MKPLKELNKKDVVVAITATTSLLATVCGGYLLSDIRDVIHETSDPVPLQGLPTYVPTSLETSAVYHSDSIAPLYTDGIVVTAQDKGVTAYDVVNNKEVWSYHRSKKLCAASLASTSKNDTIAVTFEGPAGCGETTTLDMRTGDYTATRDVLSSSSVSSVGMAEGSTLAGVASSHRVDVWRGDGVRTALYGHTGYAGLGYQGLGEIGRDGDKGCTIISASGNDSAIAVTEMCEDTTFLRIIEAVPQEPTEPEVKVSVDLDKVPAVVVAVGTKDGTDYATVYRAHGDTGQLITLTDKGVTTYLEDIPRAQNLEWEALNTVHSTEPLEDVYAADVLEKDHSATVTSNVSSTDVALTWFDGNELHLLGKDTATPIGLAGDYDTEGHGSKALKSAIGTATYFANHLVVPTPNAIAFIDINTGLITREIAVDRGEWTGSIKLDVAAGAIIETRGDTSYVLSLS